MREAKETRETGRTCVRRNIAVKPGRKEERHEEKKIMRRKGIKINNAAVIRE